MGKLLDFLLALAISTAVFVTAIVYSSALLQQ